MNLITLYTHNQTVRVNSYDIQNKVIMPCYNRNGRRITEENATKKQREHGYPVYGVHRDNLYASKKLAEMDRKRIFELMLKEVSPC